MTGIRTGSHFRRWIMEKWFEHQEEVYTWGEPPPSDSAAYFRKYKWWLKSLYKRETRIKNGTYT
jgi:hypothetical protein